MIHYILFHGFTGMPLDLMVGFHGMRHRSADGGGETGKQKKVFVRREWMDYRFLIRTNNKESLKQNPTILFSFFLFFFFWILHVVNHMLGL